MTDMTAVIKTKEDGLAIKYRHLFQHTTRQCVALKIPIEIWRLIKTKSAIVKTIYK